MLSRFSIANQIASALRKTLKMSTAVQGLVALVDFLRHFFGACHDELGGIGGLRELLDDVIDILLEPSHLCFALHGVGRHVPPTAPAQRRLVQGFAERTLELGGFLARVCTVALDKVLHATVELGGFLGCCLAGVLGLGPGLGGFLGSCLAGFLNLLLTTHGVCSVGV